MVYVIGYGMRNKKDVSTAERTTAREALDLVDNLQRSDEEIKFIRAPSEPMCDVALLRVLAKEEAAREDVSSSKK